MIVHLLETLSRLLMLLFPHFGNNILQIMFYKNREVILCEKQFMKHKLLFVTLTTYTRSGLFKLKKLVNMFAIINPATHGSITPT